MSRIKKRGLDYFPINTDFIHDRLIHRIMKREGDASLAVLFQTLCSIYSGEGYYVKADNLFYDDLADSLFQQDSADVERIIRLAVEYGLFDAHLYEECHVLTSAAIQRQYLFITKRRISSTIDACYNLLPAEPPMNDPAEAPVAETSESSAEGASAKQAEEEAGDSLREPQNVTANGITATFQSENSGKAFSGTQSIAKKSIAKQRKENSLLNSSPETGGTEDADGMSAEEDYLRKIESMKPPKDGLQHNLSGLIFNLRELHISPQEQYAIIIKTNFGIIGHPLWKGFCTLRESHGKIRQPGRYLLSLCKPAAG